MNKRKNYLDHGHLGTESRAKLRNGLADQILMRHALSGLHDPHQTGLDDHFAILLDRLERLLIVGPYFRSERHVDIDPQLLALELGDRLKRIVRLCNNARSHERLHDGRERFPVHARARNQLVGRALFLQIKLQKRNRLQHRCL